jgi:hypothetical protein
MCSQPKGVKPKIRSELKKIVILATGVKQRGVKQGGRKTNYPTVKSKRVPWISPQG